VRWLLPKDFKSEAGLQTRITVEMLLALLGKMWTEMVAIPEMIFCNVISQLLYSKPGQATAKLSAALGQILIQMRVTHSPKRQAVPKSTT
jgi:hypothetical protein